MPPPARRALALLTLAFVAGCLAPAAVPEAPATTRTALVLETDLGTMTLVLFPELMPETTARVLGLARDGFYDGRIWERVVDNFVVQSEEREGDDVPTLPLETHPDLQFAAGVVGMARELDPDTATHVFFVTEYPQPHLHRQEGSTLVFGVYAAFGQLVEGWDVLRATAAVPTRPPPEQERPVEDVRILSAREATVEVDADFDRLYPRVVAGRATTTPYRVSLEHDRCVEAGLRVAHLAWFVESQLDRSADTGLSLAMTVTGPDGRAVEVPLVADESDGNVHRAPGATFGTPGRHLVSVAPSPLAGAPRVEFAIEVLAPGTCA